MEKLSSVSVLHMKKVKELETKAYHEYIIDKLYKTLSYKHPSLSESITLSLESGGKFVPKAYESGRGVPSQYSNELKDYLDISNKKYYVEAPATDRDGDHTKTGQCTGEAGWVDFKTKGSLQNVKNECDKDPKCSGISVVNKKKWNYYKLNYTPSDSIRGNVAPMDRIKRKTYKYDSKGRRKYVETIKMVENENMMLPYWYDHSDLISRNRGKKSNGKCINEKNKNNYCMTKEFVGDKKPKFYQMKGTAYMLFKIELDKKTSLISIYVIKMKNADKNSYDYKQLQGALI